MSKSNYEGQRNLEGRTNEFGKRVIRLCRALRHGAVNDRLIKQVVGSGNPVGANYCEANDALSKKDMLNRFRIVRKEAKLHLEQIEVANPDIAPRMNSLIQEADELKRIFSSIIGKLGGNNKDE